MSYSIFTRLPDVVQACSCRERPTSRLADETQTGGEAVYLPGSRFSVTVAVLVASARVGSSITRMF